MSFRSDFYWGGATAANQLDGKKVAKEFLVLMYVLVVVQQKVKELPLF